MKSSIRKSTSAIASVLLASLFFCGTIYGNSGPRSKKDKTKADAAKVSSWLKNRPVEFLENKGQILNTDGKVANNVFFKAEGPGVDLYLTETGLTYVFIEYEEEKEKEKEKEKGGEEVKEVKYDRIDVNLAGAQIKKENIITEDAGPAYFNFVSGPADKSIYHVQKYRKITVKNVYPGIDWVLYNSSAAGFKYDFIVRPGADPKLVELVYKAGKPVRMGANGNLVLENRTGTLEENAPYTYVDKTQNKVESSFILKSAEKRNGVYESHIGFKLAPYDPSATVVIDPQLVWATFYGGTSFEGTYAIDTDNAGNVFLCGYLGSNNFPIMDAGTYFQTFVSGTGFIVKFNNTGTLIWATYFGPGTTTYLAADNTGNLFVCGVASATSFPTVNASTYYQATSGGSQDAYIAKFNSVGALTWSTFYGGISSEQATCIDTDQNGNVFLVGITTSTNFPLQNAGSYFEPVMTGSPSGFIVKFDNLGNRLWATYIKGLTNPIATTDLNGNIFITGPTTSTNTPLVNAGGTSYYQGTIAGLTDLYILKFTNTGALTWGTFYGGTNTDRSTSVATDRAGNIFVTGQTNSMNFPVMSGGPGTYLQATNASTLQDIFIVKFNSALATQWSTYVGGTRNDTHFESDNLAIDTCGNVFLGFTTVSRNLPFLTACDGGMFDNSIDTSVNANGNNVYLVRFSNTGAMMWSTLFGGDGNSFRTTLAADKLGNVFFSGEWNGVVNAATYPLMWPGGTTYTSGFMGYEDLYVAKFTNNLPLQNFSYANVCLSDPSASPTLAPGFLMGGTFTAAPGLSVNPQTGQISPNLSTPGTHTVSYKMAPCYCPGVAPVPVGTATINIITAPLLTISGKTTMCVGEKRTYTASGGSTYTWNVGTTTPTIYLTPSGVTTLTYTVSSKDATTGCIAKVGLTVTVAKCTDISEAENELSGLQIFPNPNSGDFTITSDRDGTFLLVNELGQKIRQFTFSSQNERRTNVTGLAKGIYFLEEKGGSQNIKQKIVVTD